MKCSETQKPVLAPLLKLYGVLIYEGVSDGSKRQVKLCERDLILPFS